MSQLGRVCPTKVSGTTTTGQHAVRRCGHQTGYTMRGRFALLVLCLAASACQTSSPPKIEIDTSDVSVLSDSEVRTSLMFDFFAGVATLDGDLLGRVLCRDYASTQQIESLLDRVAAIDEEDRFQDFVAVGEDATIDPVQMEVTVDGSRTVVSLSITRDGLRCVSDVSTTDPRVSRLLAPR